MIPEFITWFAILYGYYTLRRYSLLIKSNQDGKQVAKLSTGLFVLAIGVPAGAVISGALGLFARWHPGFEGIATIISNYVNVIYPLIAFLFIYRAVRAMNEPHRSRPSVFASHGATLFVIIIGVIFCDLIARSQKTMQISYHMSYNLVMLTLAIPYMYVWFLGLFAIIEMYSYSKRVSGVLYRRGWNRLAFGLGAIIGIDILLEYLGTLYSWVNDLSLAGLLTLLYVLLFLLAGGFILVALGTKELIKIEEA